MKPKLSYTIKKEDLEKNEKERYMSRKEFSFLAFDFGESISEETYVVMSLDNFKTMYTTYKKVAEEN